MPSAVFNFMFSLSRSLILTSKAKLSLLDCRDSISGAKKNDALTIKFFIKPRLPLKKNSARSATQKILFWRKVIIIFNKDFADAVNIFQNYSGAAHYGS